MKEFEIMSYTDDSSINELRIKTMDIELTKTNNNKPYVSVDHSFGVKGVGTVALGILRNGELKVYDKFKVVPGMKDTMVRSIQKHDQNYQDAFPGEFKKVKVIMTKNEFYKEEIKKDEILYLSIGMQFFPIKVIFVGEELEIEADNKFAYVEGMKIFVINMNSKQRFVGTAKIIK